MDIIEIFERFPTQDDCITHLEDVRWHGTPVCPYCHSDNSTPMADENRHHCNNCNTSYSVTVGTIFHHTHLPIQKWLLAVMLILNAKKGIAARQLARDLKVNKNTAWRISMKIREAMSQKEQRTLLTGIVEADETYVGGSPRRRGPGDTHHKRGRGTKKTPVVGMIERGGRVKAEVCEKLSSKKLCALVRKNVDISNSTLMTDQFTGYLHIKTFMPHQTVNHAVWYVDGEKHTNSIESFWALLKRGIIGQFHKVSLRHLPQYLDEFCYRHNNRETDNLFDLTIMRGLGVTV